MDEFPGKFPKMTKNYLIYKLRLINNKFGDPLWFIEGRLPNRAYLTKVYFKINKGDPIFRNRITKLQKSEDLDLLKMLTKYKLNYETYDSVDYVSRYQLTQHPQTESFDKFIINKTHGLDIEKQYFKLRS